MTEDEFRECNIRSMEWSLASTSIENNLREDFQKGFEAGINYQKAKAEKLVEAISSYPGTEERDWTGLFQDALEEYRQGTDG